MVKSSEVLRLAAEYALESKQEFPLTKAFITLGAPWNISEKFSHRLWQVGYHQSRSGKERCMALCLAAAIAEDAGD